MAFPTGKKELSGAVVLAAGLVLGGFISIGARHFNLLTPGFTAPVSERRKAEAAAAEEERSPRAGPGQLPARAEYGKPAGSAQSPASGRSGRRGAPLGPIDLNAAGAGELEALDGVGPALAARIIELRVDKGGCFRSVEELLEVKGIGPATLERIRKSVTLATPGGGSQKMALRKSTSSQTDSSSFQR